MENNQDTKALLMRLEKNSRRQALFTQVLCVLCAAVLVCTLVLTVAIAGVTAELSQTIQPLQQVAGQVQDMANQVQTVITNLDTVTQALADADLSSIVADISALATDSQTAVAEAMEKLDTIDIDTLNKAITDLAEIVEPLAKVAHIFG